MDGYLRQATASQTRNIGPFIDDADFKSVENGLTIANTDIKLSANGGAQANKNSGGATSLTNNGMYAVTFDATDTATVGELTYSVLVAGALLVWGKFTVLEEAVYDALFAASAPGYLQPTTAGRTLDVSAGGEAGIDWANIGSPTTAQNLSGTNIDVDQVVASVTGNVGGNVTGSVGSVATGGITSGSFAANAIDAAALATDAATEIATAVWASGTRTLTSFGTLIADTVAALLGYFQLMLRSDAAIATDRAAELSAINADEGSGAGSYANTTDAQQAIRDNQTTPPTVADIADGVWDETLADHLGAGSTGAALNAAGAAGDPWSTAIPGAYGAGTAGFIVGNNLDASVADVEADTQNIQSRLPAALVSGRIDSSVGAMAANTVTSTAIQDGALTAAKFAAGAFDAVWTVATRTLTSFGTLAADVWASVTRTLTAATNITSTGGTTVPQTGDSFARLGAPVGASISADIAAVKAQTAAIEVDTQDLQTQIGVAGAGLTALGDARIANLDATVSSRATPAQVNTEVVDALNVDTYAEPTGVPPATASLQRKVSQVYMALRNEVTVDANTGKKQFHDDGGAAEWEKDFTDAGGVYNESEGNAP